MCWHKSVKPDWNAEKSGGVVGILIFGMNGLMLLLSVKVRREKWPEVEPTSASNT